MSNRRIIFPGIVLCGGMLSLPLQAYDFEQISINGFGSIIAAQTLDSDERLYGNDNDLSFQRESRFALQVAAPIGEKFTATAQILARGDDDWDPDFEWAYLSYQATDNLTVMAGRQRFNIYKYSDYVDVGYAYHWVRPPQGVYSLDFSSGSGIGFSYNRLLGNVEASFTYKFLGEEISDYEPDGAVDIDPASLEATMSHVVNFDFTWNDFNFGANFALIPELSYDSTELKALAGVLADPSILGLPGAVTPAGLTPAEVDAIMSDVYVDDTQVNFYGAYVGYDPGPWFLLAEFTYYEFEDDNAFSDQKSLYISTGVRIDAFTIYGTWGQDDNDPTSDVYKSVDNPILQDLVKSAVKVQEEDSNIYSVGARWDVDTGVALKIDYTSFDDDFNDDTDADLISAGVDFVF